MCFFICLIIFSDDSNVNQNREIMHHHLQSAGFPDGEISKAFDWLESLGDEDQYALLPHDPLSMRVFAAKEKRWLNTDCQNYLLYLQHTGVLKAGTREFIIDKVLALRDVDFDLDKLKWVVLIVFVE